MLSHIPLLRRALPLVGALLLVSCANKSLVRLEKLAKPAEQGDYAAATAAVKKEKEDLYGSNSEFLYEFDLGLLFHYQGQWDSSLVHLARAEQVLEDLYARSITNEALSVLTNDNARPYRSRPYEELWMQQIQVLNYLAKGDGDGAAVQMRRALIAQEALQQKDPKKYNDEPALRYLGALAFEQNGSEDDALISYFHTLKGYARASVPLPPQVHEISWYQLKNHDRESDLQELSSHTPASENLARSLSEADGEIVVVGYAGQGPVLDELRFWGTYVRDGLLVYHYKDPESGQEITQALPAPGLPPGSSQSGSTLHINFATPKMQKRPSLSESFAVRVDDKLAARTETLADMQALLARNLDEESAAVITRTVIRVAVRTFAAQTAKSKLNTGNPLLNLLINVGTDVGTDQLEEADLRIGLFLPRTLQLTRIPATAGTHSVTLDVLDAHGRKIGEQSYPKVSVRKGQKTFLFVPSLR